MHLGAKTLLTAAILLVASIAVAQEPDHSPDPDLMARLLYDDSGVVSHGNVCKVCVAVSRNGDYRIVRWSENSQTQRLYGKMPPKDFRQFSDLIGASEFRSLSGSHGGLIRQEAENFVAEIPLGYWLHAAVPEAKKAIEKETWRLQWLNGDGENPFPSSVSKVLDWLHHFQPRDGKSFEEVEFPNVCPAGGLRLLQPSVAENSHP